MPLKEDVKERISEIVKDGDEMWERTLEWSRSIATEDGNIEIGTKEHEAQYDILEEYEGWHSQGRFLVSAYLPNRESEFENLHDNFRKALMCEVDIDNAGSYQRKLLGPIKSQKAILQSIPDKVEIEELKARKQISEKITIDEIQRAKTLIEESHVRPAGVVAGVALERHLLTLCETSDQDLDFGYMDGIASLAKTLSNAGEIDDNKERQLEYLGGIRNDCSHANKEEPNKAEVERLIDQSQEFIQENHIKV